METIGKVVGKNIALIRENRGIKQKDLAKNVKISVQTLNRIEAGNVPSPRHSTIEPIARALGCPLLDLYQREAPPQSQRLIYSEAADVLVRLSNLKPVKRQIALALIFQDASHVSDKRLAQLIRPLLKAQE